MEKSPLLLIKTVFKKSKVSGTYTVTMSMLNEEIKVVQKKLMDFQNQNMQAMNAAQQAKDTAVITNLMKFRYSSGS
jgi:phage host-nuclease inhibitor protein Gam